MGQFYSSLKQRLSAHWNILFGYRHVLRVGLPLVASMASQTLMLFVDRLFLSHYSVSAIAAALPAGCLAYAIQIAFIGICGYVSVFIAQYIGARQPQHVGIMLWQSLWLSVFFSLLLAIFALYLVEPVFVMTGHEEHIAALEIAFCRFLLLGSFPMLLASAFSAFFVGLGRTKPVLLANLAGVAVNIPLDWLLIFGNFGLPELGIAGAAMATIAGQAFSAILLGIFVFRDAECTRYALATPKLPKLEFIARLLRYGGPSGFHMLIDMAGFSWFLLRLGRLGETALAASNIAFSINTIVFLPMMGLNSAVASLVGTALGSGDIAGAKRATISTLHISLAYMTPLALSFVCCGEWYIGIFQSGENAASAEVYATGVILLRYVAAYSLVDSCNIVYFGALKGAGDTLFIMFSLGMLAACSLALPIFILEQFGLATLHSLWIVLTVYAFALALLAWWRFSSGCWQEIRLARR